MKKGLFLVILAFSFFLFLPGEEANSSTVNFKWRTYKCGVEMIQVNFTHYRAVQIVRGTPHERYSWQIDHRFSDGGMKIKCRIDGLPNITQYFKISADKRVLWKGNLRYDYDSGNF